jgi:tetratricopeptide (TPR) repeat protein
LPDRTSGTGGPRWAVLLAGCGLALATFAAYQNSLRAPFVLDDPFSIVANLTIRHLWRFWEVLAPPGGGVTVSGRPVLNFSLAINYAVSGLDVWSYHALNVIIHALAGLTLFGIVRRTLALSGLTRTIGDVRRSRRTPPQLGTAAYGDVAPQSDSTLLAFTVALLWTLHPLQTESVTYVVQRAESMMGLFYLLTLYGFIRTTESLHAGRWRVFSITACLLGMATKEVMVSAPLMVLLYDRTFVAGSFREAWRRNQRLYLGLAATWFLLGYLVAGTGGNRSGSVGFGINVSWWAYALTQFQAIAHYLWLSFWPHPLVFDYGPLWVTGFAGVAPYVLTAIALVAGTLIALRHRPAIGFLGCWFFAILAPTSLVPGTTQMIVEHRMYLSLAAVVALVVPGFHALAGRRGLVACATLAIALGWLTERRNADYRSELILWSDTVGRSPDSVMAHNNLGHAFFQLGRMADAKSEFEAVLRLNPAYPEAHYNLGSALLELGRAPEAIGRLEEAIRLKPTHANAHNNLGSALLQTGRPADAIKEYEEALRLNPNHPKAHYNLATALLEMGRQPEAIRELEATLRVNPADTKAHNNLGNLLYEMGRTMEAVAQFEEALRIDPGYANAHNNLGTVLFQIGRLTEAIRHHAEAVRLEPNSPEMQYNLGNALFKAGRLTEAGGHYQAALRLRPGYEPPREMLRRLQALQPASGSPE